MTRYVMAAPIQVKATYYAGEWFQSLTEARWAFMFDQLGIPWQFEIQRFYLNTSSDHWYLPDFYLPEFFTWWSATTQEPVYGLWIEVKGHVAGTKELERCQQLAERTQRQVLFVKSAPGWVDADYRGHLLFTPGELEPLQLQQFAMCNEGHLAIAYDLQNMKPTCRECALEWNNAVDFCYEDYHPEDWELDIANYRLLEAQEAALRERFEHRLHGLPTVLGRWNNARTEPKIT